MSRQVVFDDQVIEVFSKDDGDAKDLTHPLFMTYTFATQTHSTDIVICDGCEWPWQLPQTADALIAPKELPIGVYVGDCIPLILLSKKLHAAVHLSWKTLYTWLLHKVVGMLTDLSQPPHLARIGPSIRTYEVWPEFATYFPAPFLTPHGKKYHLDMVGYTSSLLQYHHLPLENIIIDPVCTLVDTSYRSYRRGEHGRNFIGVRARW